MPKSKRTEALTSSVKHDWRTPVWVLDLVRKVGPVALDPCPSRDREHWFATSNAVGDGLVFPWHIAKDAPGLVYCNPPYGRELPKWVNKINEEAEYGLEIILLCPARPGSKWWKRVWKSADAFCFIDGRITFEQASAPPLFPSALFYWGSREHKFCRAFQNNGIVGIISNMYDGDADA